MRHLVQNGFSSIKIPAKISSGPGSGTIYSAGGVNGRGFASEDLESTTTASAFGHYITDLNWNFDQTTFGYATKYQAYVNGLPIDITIQSYHLNDFFISIH